MDQPKNFEQHLKNESYSWSHPNNIPRWVQNSFGHIEGQCKKSQVYRINDFYFCIFFMITQNTNTYIEKLNTVPDWNQCVEDGPSFGD